MAVQKCVCNDILQIVYLGVFGIVDYESVIGFPYLVWRIEVVMQRFSAMGRDGYSGNFGMVDKVDYETLTGLLFLIISYFSVLLNSVLLFIFI